MPWFDGLLVVHVPHKFVSLMSLVDVVEIQGACRRDRIGDRARASEACEEPRLSETARTLCTKVENLVLDAPTFLLLIVNQP